MELSWKIVIILFFLILIVVWFVTTCNSNKQVQRVMEKLDSTKIVLDSARAHVDSSKKVIRVLQTDLNNYSQLLYDVNDHATMLAKQHVKTQVQFVTKLNTDSVRFEELKKQVMFYMHNYWPEVSVDTTK